MQVTRFGLTRFVVNVAGSYPVNSHGAVNIYIVYVNDINVKAPVSSN